MEVFPRSLRLCEALAAVAVLTWVFRYCLLPSAPAWRQWPWERQCPVSAWDKTTVHSSQEGLAPQRPKSLTLSQGLEEEQQIKPGC